MPSKPEYLKSIAQTHLDGWVTVGCIPAPGQYRDKDGYGTVQVWTDGKERGYKAHNYVLRLTDGEPTPDKPQANHTCRGKCVNPAHVQWGTQLDNMMDRERDGTVPYTRGETHGSAKLTDEKVRELFRLRAEGWTQQALADRYGVNESTVRKVLKGERWGHISRG